jgi:hypothetical protein
VALAEGAIGKNPQATGPIDEGVLSLALEAQQAATLGCFVRHFAIQGGRSEVYSRSKANSRAYFG